MSAMLNYCNAEPTIIRRVITNILQNNCYCNLDDKPENVQKIKRTKNAQKKQIIMFLL